MKDLSLPFSHQFLLDAVKKYPTPFHIYDEAAIRRNAARLRKAFSWVPGGFRNHFAVKALPNPRILSILAEEGMGADCSSLAELRIAEMCGLSGDLVFLTANDTPAAEFIYARKLSAIINLDDISHIPFLKRHAGIPDTICLRYNPGPLKKGNAIIGKPEEAKYGFTQAQILEGCRILKAEGVRHFGIHTMVASNELNPDYFIETARILFELAGEITETLSIPIEFINLGGGIGIPYRPEQQRMDTYKTYVGLDSCMANLMRPALYGAYHHVTVPGKPADAPTIVCDITGSLCENNDKFAIDRTIPAVEPGDLLVIHDTGAHGHAMGFNYNGKLRSAELLMKPDGSLELIRRAETLDDYFATLDLDSCGTR
jgi:diaminopimelate decarboxylase